ncbi:MAG TPA: CHASE2 domain-containing protein, partial [Verrucomicrobiae bacterium]|nr:CHASE2 domain-containing protein [Verrucomicrobiae bacterium]
MQKSIRQRTFLTPVLGAVFAALAGLLLWSAPVGEPWINTSYDYLFRFGRRPVTNQVVLVMMDNAAYSHFDQSRDSNWDRSLHARLLNKLADDGCSLVVLDIFFRKPDDPAKDAELVAAMRRQKHIVLMADKNDLTSPEMTGMQPRLPARIFLDAASTNWGIGAVIENPDLDPIVRRHWPFPAPGSYPSLAWTAALLAGAKLDNTPHEQWLRYYGRNGSWTRMSYE